MPGGIDWMGLLLLAGAVLLVAPRALRILRHDRRLPHYIALWLAIALALAAFYRFLGPF